LIFSSNSARIVITTKRKEAKMGNYQIGDNFTTLTSGVTGVIKEIHPQASGSVRILLDVQGNERWTTWSAK